MPTHQLCSGVYVTAQQWFRHGDSSYVTVLPAQKTKSTRLCYCGELMEKHGVLKKGGKICPGDWIITNSNGDIYSCNKYTFMTHYKPIK